MPVNARNIPQGMGKFLPCAVQGKAMGNNLDRSNKKRRIS